jgi:hypothetical protein
VTTLVWPATAQRKAPRLDPRIPPTDRALYAEEWKTRWRNPRVLVDRDGVFLLVGGKPLGEDAKYVDDVAAALAALPRKAWPHGRVVALTKTGRVRDSALFDRAREAIASLGVEAIETPVGCACE